MPAVLDCPEIDPWQALFGGALAPDEQERYERHLDACAACQERLDQSGECSDPLRRLVRRVGDPTAVPADPTLTQFLERLHEGKSPVRTTLAEPADLYFLGPTDRPDLLGVLGPYEVQEVIGQGGMGVVLKAYEPALHRLVAIKVLAAAVAGSAVARRRFKREAQAAASVCNDHVVTVHGVHDVDDLPYLVMQYIAGESLQDRLDRTGPLELSEVVRIGLQTAWGLAAAHTQGLIHRDIKPANLLLENGLARVKITDFGLARMADDVGLTQDGVVAGTPEYMAPEQARGEPVDHRADLFSLGSVLYAMCTGVPPFRGPSTVAVLRQVSDHVPAPVRTLNPDIPAWLEALVARLLAKDPAERFQTAAEVAALLEGYLAHLRQPATVAAPELPAFSTDAGPRPAAAERRTGLAAWLCSPRRFGALVLLAVLGLSSVGLFQNPAPTPQPGSRGDPPANPEGEAKLKTGYAREYHHSFKGDRELSEGFQWDGIDPADCLTFVPEGLRLELPTDHPGRRIGTGLCTNFAIQGDFEITIDYEILKEPEPADAGLATGVYLWVDLDLPGMNRAILTRGVWPTRQYSTWLHLAKEGSGEPPTDEMRRFPATSMSGRLRLVRSGALLSHYAADGPGKEFVFLRQHVFGTEDLKHVRIGGHTGGPKAALDARFTDLRIRAGSLPDVPEPALASSEKAGTGWLYAGLVIGLLFACSLALGGWLLVRQRRRTAEPPARAAVADERGKPEPEPAAVSVTCATCGKKLKARAELAGKRVKCPQCGQGVHVPSIQAGTP